MGAAQIRSANMQRAAITWLLSGVMYLTLEAISAVAFPHYNYARNFISALGDVNSSPLWALMNFDFVAHGLLFLIAGIFAFRASATGAARYVFFAFACLHFTGFALVGVFHGPAPFGTPRFHWHVLGAWLAFFGGNIAIIVAGICADRYAAPVAYRAPSILLGCLGIWSCLGPMSENLFNSAALWERVSVYSFVVWEVVTGIVLLLAKRRQESPIEASS